MPTYEYYCEHCKRKFEQYHSVEERDQGVCEVCGAQCKRVFVPVPIIFKGKGWHITDYGKGTAPSTGAGSSEPGKGNGKHKAEKADSPSPAAESAPATSK